LLSVQQERVQVRAVVAGLGSGLLDKRPEGPVQVRCGGLGWNFEWNFYQLLTAKVLCRMVFVLPTGEPAM